MKPVFTTMRPLLNQRYPVETIDEYEDILTEYLLYCNDLSNANELQGARLLSRAYHAPHIKHPPWELFPARMVHDSHIIQLIIGNFPCISRTDTGNARPVVIRLQEQSPKLCNRLLLPFLPLAFYSGMFNLLLDTVYAIICEPDYWSKLFKHVVHPKSLAGFMVGRLHWDVGKRLLNFGFNFKNRGKHTPLANPDENDVRKNREVLKQALADFWAGRGSLMENYADFRDQIEGTEFWKASHEDELRSRAENPTPFTFARTPKLERTVNVIRLYCILALIGSIAEFAPLLTTICAAVLWIWAFCHDK